MFEKRTFSFSSLFHGIWLNDEARDFFTADPLNVCDVHLQYLKNQIVQIVQTKMKLWARIRFCTSACATLLQFSCKCVKAAVYCNEPTHSSSSTLGDI